MCGHLWNSMFWRMPTVQFYGAVLQVCFHLVRHFLVSLQASPVDRSAKRCLLYPFGNNLLTESPKHSFTSTCLHSFASPIYMFAVVLKSFVYAVLFPALFKYLII